MTKEYLKYPIQWKNSVKFNKKNKDKCSETTEHKVAKALICIVLSDNGLDYCTEAEFKDGQRADIILLDYDVAIEILNTESIKKFNQKRYPITTIPITTNTSIEYIKAMISDIIATKGTGAEYYARR